MRGRVVKRRHASKTPRLVARRLVLAHLREMGGPAMGWSYDAPYRRLAQEIERALRGERVDGGGAA